MGMAVRCRVQELVVQVDYTQDYHTMLEATDTDHATWYRVPANDKRSARLNCISHFLSMIPYQKIPFEAPQVPKKRKRGEDVPDSLQFTHTVPAVF